MCVSIWVFFGLLMTLFDSYMHVMYLVSEPTSMDFHYMELQETIEPLPKDSSFG